MKLKSISALSVLVLTAFVTSCGDGLDTIGSTIVPEGNIISIATDTVPLKARTIAVDSVYARTSQGVLGKYEDELFGSIKSDYLCQFYFPEKKDKFKENLVAIDSMLFTVTFNEYIGDDKIPMGLSVYKVNKPLTENFYTNVDPKKYCDFSLPLTSTAYTIKGARIPDSSYPTYKQIVAPLDTMIARNIIKGSYDGTIKDSESFAKFFPGVYVTTSFGGGNLVHVATTTLEIYYKYNHIKGNAAGTGDTIRTANYNIDVSPEVIQLNHIENRNTEALFAENSGAVYLKTPAGVFTEIEIPIKQIADNMAKSGTDMVNSASLRLKGYTEKENFAEFSPARPANLLFIEKDSLNDFFVQRKVTNGKTSFLTTRTSTNTYNFSNLSPLIDTYRKKGVDKVKFVLLPVTISTIAVNGSPVITGIYNTMSPTTAILRNGKDDIEFQLIYSKIK